MSNSGKADPFFAVIPDTNWNACVGIQGHVENYVDGYLEAALELVAAVIDKKLLASRDTLAMPILYNARHALELSIKLAIDRLSEAGAVANKAPPNHDIRHHWTILSDANIGDSAIRQIVAHIEPFVISLAAVDDDGQELRYAQNRDGQQSMRNVAIVNLPHIRNSLHALSSLLTRLKNRVIDYSAERSTGTFTRDCSRADLEEIAAMLGDHATWRDESFNTKKDAIRKRFGLSSGKFADAVTAIRNSRELAGRVGLEAALKHLSDEQALSALQRWCDANPLRTVSGDLGTDFFERDLDAIREHRQRTGELVKAIADSLSDGELADLEALFYIGRGRDMGEYYEEISSRALKEFQLLKSRLEAILHIMTKTSLLENVIAGSVRVGRPSLAAKLRALRPENPVEAPAR